MGSEMCIRDSTSTEVEASLNIDIPAVLKPMVGGTMQKAVDQFGVLIGQLSR